jgi:hypothetical protein
MRCLTVQDVVQATTAMLPVVLVLHVALASILPRQQTLAAVIVPLVNTKMELHRLVARTVLRDDMAPTQQRDRS